MNIFFDYIVCELTVRAGSMIYLSEQSAADKNDALDSANFDEEYISKSIGSPNKIPFTLVNELKQGKASI